MGLEAGFARSRETVNVLLECVFDTAFAGLLYWAIGFAFQSARHGLIGHQFFFLHGMTPPTALPRSPSWPFFLFQFAFADTARRDVGACGPNRFKGDILTQCVCLV